MDGWGCFGFKIMLNSLCLQCNWFRLNHKLACNYFDMQFGEKSTNGTGNEYWSPSGDY